MYSVFDSRGNLIYANDATCGIYWCTECGKKSHYREPDDKAPHFYHYEYNPRCSRSSEKDDGTWISNQISRYISTAQGTREKDWFEAIEGLWQFDALKRLEGKSWAARPIVAYLTKGKYRNKAGLRESLIAILYTISSTKNILDACKEYNASSVLSLLGKTDNGKSMILESLKSRDYSSIDQLIETLPDLNLAIDDGIPILALAVKYCDSNIANKLIQKGAVINASDTLGRTPLFHAIINNNQEASDFLIKNGANVNLSDNNGRTPIHLACDYCLKGTVSLLIESGADVNSKDNRDITPLSLSVSKGNDDIVALLLRNGANPNIADKDSDLPILVACENGFYGIAAFLIENNANINCHDINGVSPLLSAIINEYEELPELLIKNGADVNQSDISGNTPLIIACKNGFEDDVTMLLQNGAYINSRDKDGASPLLHSIRAQHFNIARHLIVHKADVNIADANGNTALIQSLSNQQVALAKLIIANGAVVDVADNSGRTPLFLSILNTIRARNTRNHQNSLDYYNIVESIVNKGSNAMVSLNNSILLEAFSIYGYNGSIRSFDGCPLLMLALFGNHIDIAELLIIGNVDVNARSSNGRTPISWARENNKENIVAFLIQNGAEG